MGRMLNLLKTRWWILALLLAVLGLMGTATVYALGGGGGGGPPGGINPVRPPVISPVHV